MAKDAVNKATVIVDGEVVRPFIDNKQTALVRVVHVLKGPPVIEVEVGARDSCSIALMKVGERARMLLTGGPAVYDLQYDAANARNEDRLLGSDRRTVWPYRAGELSKSVLRPNGS